MIRVTPNVVECTSAESLPLYNLIIGRETLSKLKLVLNLKNSTIEVNSVTLPMQSLSAIQPPQYAMNLYRELLEPKSVREKTNCTFCILNATYEKSFLQDEMNAHC